MSDYAPDGYNCVCQHRLIQALQRLNVGPEYVRTYPPCLLEWTANRKRANTVLHIYCFDGEQTHTHTHVLWSLFAGSFPSCRCVIPVSGAFLDDRRRNGQRHSPAQVCLKLLIFITACLDQLEDTFVCIVFCAQGCVGGSSRLVCVTEGDGSVGGAGGLRLCAGSNVRPGASC